MHRSFVVVVALAVVIAGLVALGRPAAGAAQEGSPAGTPGAAACTVEPRPVDELVAVWFDPEGSPVATPPPQPAVTSEADLPQGEPADEATVAAVNAAFRELIACFEANQFARAFALMTDDLARQLGPNVTDPTEDTPEEVRALLEAQLAGTPAADEDGPPAGERLQVPDAREVRILPDGRAGGVWEIEGDVFFVAFEREDDRWLVDELIDVEEAVPEASTPAA